MAYATYRKRVDGLPTAYSSLRQNAPINPYGQGQAAPPATCPPCRCPSKGVNGLLVLGLVTGATLLGVAIAS